jgi:hypothetical protein
MRLLTSVRAAVTRASSARSSMFGTISAASTPMMTSTTISSIRVKPRLRALLGCSSGAIDIVVPCGVTAPTSGAAKRSMIIATCSLDCQRS